MRVATLLLLSALCWPPRPVAGQGLDPALLTKPATDAWPTFAGDYSQRRFSTLAQIDTTNVRRLTLAWVRRLTAGPDGRPATITGGVAENPVSIPGSTSGSPRLSGSVLQVNGILYVSSPDNAWAIDARDGHVLWHYWWKSRGAIHIGNRGMAMYGDWLYFETPDNYLVSLDARTGQERWHKEIADFSQQYFSTAAPVVVGDHVLVGTGNDLDSPGFLQSFDPRTGELQWKFYTVPMNPGDPGLETWASLDAARHGGAQAWMPGSYDPETKLYIFGTGNPTPAYTARVRGPKGEANLFTCTIIAVNVETGKMVWYFQPSPTDTHDWDATQPPVLVDGMFKGKQRKMVMQASRNGYFFVLDRTTGEHLLTMKYLESANWADSVNARGQPERNPAKDNTVAGSLVSPDADGATNWFPPSYDPQAGLLYVVLRERFAMFYLTNTDPRMLVGLGGSEQVEVGSLGTSIVAIDYQRGRLAWKYPLDGWAGWSTGLLSTAGRLLFANDGAGNLVAYGLRGTKPPVALWHAGIGSVENAPQTYTVDGRQYVLVAAEGALYAFYLQ